MLYFAYGSNLHHFQMKRRCKDSIFIKKMNLKDFIMNNDNIIIPKFNNIYSINEAKINNFHIKSVYLL